MKFPRLVLATVLTCCSLTPVAADAPPSQADATKQELLHALPKTMQAPDFRLADMDGVEHRLSDYRGRVVVINFWATWCPPCREEMPSMQRAWRQLKESGIAMLAINVGEDEDVIFTFTANYPVDFPLLLDRDSSVIQAWPVRGLPTTFVVDPRGNIAYRAIGTRDWDDPRIVAALNALRSEKAQ